MRAAVLRSPGPIDTNPLRIEELPIPVPGEDEALLKVLACGVCHTDLHIVEGELPARLPWVIPGHQIVAEVVDRRTSNLQDGARVGVSWIGGTDGTCPFCLNGRENLCDHPTYTGYTHQGGYAEYTTARADFLSVLPEELSNNDAAPLLCAGIIGFRSVRVAEVKRGQRVGPLRLRRFRAAHHPGAACVGLQSLRIHTRAAASAACACSSAPSGWAAAPMCRPLRSIAPSPSRR